MTACLATASGATPSMSLPASPDVTASTSVAELCEVSAEPAALEALSASGIVARAAPSRSVNPAAGGAPVHESVSRIPTSEPCTSRTGRGRLPLTVGGRKVQRSRAPRPEKSRQRPTGNGPRPSGKGSRARQSRRDRDCGASWFVGRGAGWRRRPRPSGHLQGRSCRSETTRRPTRHLCNSLRQVPVLHALHVVAVAPPPTARRFRLTPDKQRPRRDPCAGPPYLEQLGRRCARREEQSHRRTPDLDSHVSQMSHPPRTHHVAAAGRPVLPEARPAIKSSCSGAGTVRLRTGGLCPKTGAAEHPDLRTGRTRRRRSSTGEAFEMWLTGPPVRRPAGWLVPVRLCRSSQTRPRPTAGRPCPETIAHRARRRPAIAATRPRGQRRVAAAAPPLPPPAAPAKVTGPRGAPR